MASQIGEREKEHSRVNLLPTQGMSGKLLLVLRKSTQSILCGLENKLIIKGDADQSSYSHPTNAPSSSGLDKLETKAEQITEPTYEPPMPFPNRRTPRKHTTQIEMMLEIFEQVKVNVPLLDAIEHVPSYAKF